MTAANILDDIRRGVAQGGRLRLFLDYDGTLAPFARTPAPEAARPDPALAALLADLAAHPRIEPVILSGRPLAGLQTLLPVPGLLMAGTYGLEVRWPDGRLTARVPRAQVRQTVEQVQSAWADLVNGRAGFFLEDKGTAIALHARFAAEAEAQAVLPAARRAAAALAPQAGFRVLGGHRFLEVAPALAHKGRSVEWLLEQMPLAGAALAYFGDDDKDEEAFVVVRARGGHAILVGGRRGPTAAGARLAGPPELRAYLRSLINTQ